MSDRRSLVVPRPSDLYSPHHELASAGTAHP